MKKYVAVFLAGALLMLSTQVIADTVSQIGKKVDSEAEVIVNGEKVSNAIIIKGKSYVPGRDVAEALGAKVEWKGGEGVVITSETKPAEEDVSGIDDIDNSILLKKIESVKQKIADYNKLIETFTSQMQSADDKTFYENNIAQLKEKVSAAQLELEKYEKELESAK